MTADQANRSYPTANLPYTFFDETTMLARIGTDLRALYGNVENAALPRDFLRLASLIDEGHQAHDRDSGAA